MYIMRKNLIILLILLSLLLMLTACFETHECEAGEWSSERVATCFENGLNVKKCIHCQRIMDTETTPKLDHIYTLLEHVSHEDGDYCNEWVYRVKCIICNLVETKDNVKSHNCTRITVGSNCTTLGYDAWYCKDCDYVEKRPLDKLGAHVYNKEEYLYDGNHHWHKCKNCDSTSDPVEHRGDENGVCTVCGAKVDYTKGVIYELSEDKSYAIVRGYTGSNKHVRIMPEYDGVPVTHIGKGAFCENSDLYSISLTSNITHIENEAFDECPYLGSVFNMENVKYIGDKAFYRNHELDLSVLPAGLEYIGENAFHYCGDLKISAIPDSVTYLGNSAFYHCQRIESLKLGNALTEISDNAFESCYNLGSIEFGENLISIGKYAFKECYYVESLVFPDSLISIGESSFTDCNRLKSVHLGKSFETIGKYALSECNALKEINAHEENKRFTCIDGVAYTKDLETIICYPSGKADGELVLPEGVKIILNYAFYGISSIKELTLPSTLVEIGRGAFLGCDQLKSVTILGETKIGDYAFGNCRNLADLHLSDKVTTIGEFAFNDCGFKSLVIPDSVTSIGRWAFAGCYYLEEVTVGSGLKHIPEGAFIYNGASLHTVIISEGVETIGEKAFAHCYSLSNLYIPDSVTAIKENAFYECTCLNDIMLGKGITEIGKGAFQHCAQFTRIYYNGTPESWDAITIDSLNTEFEYAFRRYYYSESKPEAEGRYWYYNENGKPTVWKYS